MAAPIWNHHYEKTRVGVQSAVAKGLLYEVGEFYLSETGSKKEKVFLATGVKVKKDWVVHDTMLHKYALTIPNAKVLLGYDCDPEFRADGEVTFSNGVAGVIEMDRQTASLSVVLKRLNVHKEHDKDIFFLTLSQPRIDKLCLRVRDDDLASRLWLANWYDLGDGGHLWQDIDGEKQAVYPTGG